MALTKEQAMALVKSKWWVGREPIELALFYVAEDRLCMPFDVLQHAVETVVGRPVFAHEFGSSGAANLRKEILGERQKPTLQEILAQIPEAKRLVITEPEP